MPLFDHTSQQQTLQNAIGGLGGLGGASATGGVLATLPKLQQRLLNAQQLELLAAQGVPPAGLDAATAAGKSVVQGMNADALSRAVQLPWKTLNTATTPIRQLGGHVSQLLEGLPDALNLRAPLLRQPIKALGRNPRVSLLLALASLAGGGLAGFRGAKSLAASQMPQSLQLPKVASTEKLGNLGGLIRPGVKTLKDTIPEVVIPPPKAAPPYSIWDRLLDEFDNFRNDPAAIGATVGGAAGGGIGALARMLMSPEPATEPSMKDKIKQLLLQMQQGGTDLFNRGSAAVGQAIQRL